MDKHFEIIIIHKGYFTKLCDNLTYIRGFFLYPSTYSYIKLCGFFRYDFNYIRLIKVKNKQTFRFETSTDSKPIDVTPSKNNGSQEEMQNKAYEYKMRNL